MHLQPPRIFNLDTTYRCVVSVTTWPTESFAQEAKWALSPVWMLQGKEISAKHIRMKVTQYTEICRAIISVI
jgi:hypothetical protein